MEAVHVVISGKFLKVLRAFENAVYHFFRILHGVVPTQTNQVFGGDVRVFAANGHTVCLFGFYAIRTDDEGEVIGRGQVPLAFR